MAVIAQGGEIHIQNYPRPDTKFPVIEIFGPVIEGEGPLAGKTTVFIRLGLCDSKCSWCDSMHAVDPEQVKANARYMTANEIVEEVLPLLQHCTWLTFSGGNPVLHNLLMVVIQIKMRKPGTKIKVETQGTFYQPWLNVVDLVIMSPKPPSAGELAHQKYLKSLKPLPRTLLSHHKASMTEELFYELIHNQGIGKIAVKIVVFDEKDLDYALKFAKDNYLDHLYLSCGTLPSDTRDTLGERYRWLTQIVLDNIHWFDGIELTVLPQLHVIAHLHKQGV